MAQLFEIFESKDELSMPGRHQCLLLNCRTKKILLEVFLPNFYHSHMQMKNIEREKCSKLKTSTYLLYNNISLICILGDEFLPLLIGPWEMLLYSWISNFQTHITDRYLEHFLWISWDLNDDWSILVQVMVWFHQPTWKKKTSLFYKVNTAADDDLVTRKATPSAANVLT